MAARLDQRCSRTCPAPANCSLEQWAATAKSAVRAVRYSRIRYGGGHCGCGGFLRSPPRFACPHRLHFIRAAASIPCGASIKADRSFDQDRNSVSGAAGKPASEARARTCRRRRDLAEIRPKRNVGSWISDRGSWILNWRSGHRCLPRAEPRDHYSFQLFLIEDRDPLSIASADRRS